MYQIMKVIKLRNFTTDYVRKENSRNSQIKIIIRRQNRQKYFSQQTEKLVTGDFLFGNSSKSLGFNEKENVTEKHPRKSRSFVTFYTFQTTCTWLLLIKPNVAVATGYTQLLTSGKLTSRRF